MKLFYRKLKRLVNKTVATIVFIVVVLMIIIFHSWFFTQFEHIIAYYYVYEGDQSYQHENFQDAINYYNKALSLYPEHVKARYNLGNIFVSYEDYDSALVCYEKALDSDPNFLNARINLGIILSEQIHDLDKAIEEYKKAIDSKHIPINIPFILNNIDYLDSARSVAYYNMGLAYRYKSMLFDPNSSQSRENLLHATDSYKKSLEIESNNYDTHYNLGLAYQLLGMYDDAVEQYCKAINIAPMEYEAHYNLALILRQKMNYKDALVELEKAGLLLDANGDNDRSKFVFYVLNDVTQKFAIIKQEERYYSESPKSKSEQNDYAQYEKEKEEKEKSIQATFMNGKLIWTEALDKTMLQEMKSCDSCDIIINGKKEN